MACMVGDQGSLKNIIEYVHMYLNIYIHLKDLQMSHNIVQMQAKLIKRAFIP